MRYLQPLVALFLLASWGQEVWARTEQQTILFEQNRGQFVEEVDFIARGQNYLLALGASPTIEIQKPYPLLGPQKPSTASETPQAQYYTAQRLQLNFIGSNSDSVASGLQPSKRKTHYLFGEPGKNITDAAHFRRVRYTALYDHIDIEYYYRDGFPEYDLLIQPGGSLDDVKIRYAGAEAMRIGDDGALLFTLGDTEINHPQPVAYQVINGEKKTVEVSFVLQADYLSYEVGAFDASKTLVIDPQIIFLSQYGGSESDFARNLAQDAAGNIYLIGLTASFGLASVDAYLSNNTFQRAERVEIADGDIVGETIVSAVSAISITKFSPNLDEILFSTYFYPEDTEFFSHFTLEKFADVSADGEVGFVFSANENAANFPLMNETQGYDSSKQSAYIAKLNNTGTNLVFATFLHYGTNSISNRLISGMDMADDGKLAVVASLQGDHSLPIRNPLAGYDCQAETRGQYEGYVALFDTDGTLLFSSCLGGMDAPNAGGREGLFAVHVSASSDLYVAGFTSSENYPTVSAFQDELSHTDARDVVLSVIDPVNSALKYSSYFGANMPGVVTTNRFMGEIFDPESITLDSDGNVIFSAVTNRLHLPLVNAVQNHPSVPKTSYNLSSGEADNYDNYLAKLDLDTNELIFSTYLGGSKLEQAVSSIKTDSDNNIYLMGATGSPDFPLLGSELDLGHIEDHNYVTQLTHDGKLAFSALIGANPDQGSSLRRPGDFVVTANGNLIAASNYISGLARLYTADRLALGGQQSHANIEFVFLDLESSVDSDADGVSDGLDAFPNAASEWRDTDNDGLGNHADNDDDGDGFNDHVDAFPLDPTEWADSDNDGFGDNIDWFDNDARLAFDFDADGLGDFADPDVDGDGVNDSSDRFDYDPMESKDSDNDGIGDNADDDHDNDGILNQYDLLPNDDDHPIYTFNTYSPAEGSLPLGFFTPNSSDVSWSAARDQARGSGSLGTRPLGDDQVAELQYERDLMFPALFSFWYKVQSEPMHDRFQFHLDTMLSRDESGARPWQRHEMMVPAGPHTYLWRYEKNGSVSTAHDAAWIDDVQWQFLFDIAVTVEEERHLVAGYKNRYEHRVVLNNDTHEDARVRFNLLQSPSFNNFTWTCTVEGGAQCVEMGSGSVSTDVSLPANSRVLFSVRGDEAMNADNYNLRAFIIYGHGLVDLDSSNDLSTRTFSSNLFKDGFESIP